MKKTTAKELRDKLTEISKNLPFSAGVRELGLLHERKAWTFRRVHFFTTALSTFLDTSNIWVRKSSDRAKAGLPSWTVLYNPFGICLERGARGWYRTPWEALLGIEVVLDLALQKINDGR